MMMARYSNGRRSRDGTSVSGVDLESRLDVKAALSKHQAYHKTYERGGGES